MKPLLILLLFPFALFAQYTQLNGPGLPFYGSLLPSDRVNTIQFHFGTGLYCGAGVFQGSLTDLHYNDAHQFDLNTNKWTIKNPVVAMGRNTGITGMINGKGYSIMGYRVAAGDTLFTDTWEYDATSDTWTQKANIPGIPSIGTCGFACSGKMYALTTRDTNSVTTNNLYEFDPVQNVWSGKNTPPFLGRLQAASFVIGNDAYVLGGTDSLSNSLHDLWLYDAANDSWTQKASCTFDLIGNTNTASSSSRGYVFPFGSNSIFIYDPAADSWSSKPSPGYLTAMYSDSNGFYCLRNSYVVIKYDEAANTFTTLCPDAIGLYRKGTATSQKACVNEYIYDIASDTWTPNPGLGTNTESWLFTINDTCYGIDFLSFFAFDPLTATKIVKASPPGTCSFDGFVLNGKGYIGIENSSILQLWQYDPATDQWSQRADFPGLFRDGAGGMSINNKGYLYSGYDNNSGNTIDDFWEYDPDSDQWSIKTSPPANPRKEPLCVGGNFSGFVGLGYEPLSDHYDDMYEYNPSTDSWSIPGVGGYSSSFYFMQGNTLYIGGGSEVVSHDYISYHSFGKYRSLINNMDEIKLNEEFSMTTVVQNELLVKSGSKINQVEIFDMQGRIIYSDGNGKNEMTIGTTKLSEGIYFLRINQSMMRKFLRM